MHRKFDRKLTNFFFVYLEKQKEFSYYIERCEIYLSHCLVLIL